MAYGQTPCLIDSSITTEQAYEQTLGPVPDGYHAAVCCGTLNCVRHVTIRRHVPGRFDNPDSAPVIGDVPTRTRPVRDESRLKLAQSMYARGRNKFKSDATTWKEYCEDYITSPLTTAEESRIFCYRHRLRLGLSCLCGQKHKHQQRSDESECRLYNPVGYDLQADINAGTATNCGLAITGEMFGRIPPRQVHDDKAISAASAEQDSEAAAYLEASREISRAFRVIRVIKDGETLRPWR